MFVAEPYRTSKSMAANMHMIDCRHQLCKLLQAKSIEHHLIVSGVLR
jgi:hypothetical protein